MQSHDREDTACSSHDPELFEMRKPNGTTEIVGHCHLEIVRHSQSEIVRQNMHFCVNRK
jgi:hypothetical protein